MTVSLRPPAWSYFLILAGVVVFVIVALALRKTVVVPGWPFCARCQELRSRRLKTGLGLLGGAVVVLVGSTVVTVAVTNDTAGASIIAVGNVLFLAGLIAGIVVLAQSGWRAVAAAVVSPDGLWVSVPSPSQAFGEQVAAALAGLSSPTAVQPPNPR